MSDESEQSPRFRMTRRQFFRAAAVGIGAAILGRSGYEDESPAAAPVESVSAPREFSILLQEGPLDPEKPRVPAFIDPNGNMWDLLHVVKVRHPQAGQQMPSTFYDSEVAYMPQGMSQDGVRATVGDTTEALQPDSESGFLDVSIIRSAATGTRVNDTWYPGTQDIVYVSEDRNLSGLDVSALPPDTPIIVRTGSVAQEFLFHADQPVPATSVKLIGEGSRTHSCDVLLMGSASTFSGSVESTTQSVRDLIGANYSRDSIAQISQTDFVKNGGKVILVDQIDAYTALGIDTNLTQRDDLKGTFISIFSK